MLRQNSGILTFIFILVDLFILLFAYIFSRFLVFGHLFFDTITLKEVILFVITTFFFFILLERIEFSQPYRFRPLIKIILGILQYELYIISFLYLFTLFDIFEFQNNFVLYYVSITLFCFLPERIVVKIFLTILRKNGFNFKRYLIIGAGTLGLNFYYKVKNSNELGIKIVGFLDDDKEILENKDSRYIDEIRSLILGTTDLIETALMSNLVDNVVIALPMQAKDKIVELANICEKHGAKAELIPDYYRIISENPSVRVIKGYPLIGIRNIPFENVFNKLTKRLFDFWMALVGLVLLSPLFLVIMLGIKLTSKGPVFFRQKRTGYDQKEFNIIKFRTMEINKESDIKQATKDDPRKTKFGNFLRKTNLDELPQIFNIIRGEMSIVGPRPHMLTHTEEFYHKYDKYLVRHWVKPGLTGWAQVNGWRGDSDIGMRVKYDIEYIENWSLWFDIKIILLTIFGKNVKNNAV